MTAVEVAVADAATGVATEADFCSSSKFESQGWVVGEFRNFDAIECEIAASQAAGTAFGKTEWSVIQPSPIPSALAATKERMGLHTDNSYAAAACELVGVFCETQAEMGGQSLLADFLSVEADLSAVTIDVLRDPIWRWRRPRRLGGGWTDPLPAVGPHGIRWWSAIADLSDSRLARAAEEVDAALQAVAVAVDLGPGTLLVLDNKRIVHDRNPFVGARRIHRLRAWPSTTHESSASP